MESLTSTSIHDTKQYIENLISDILDDISTRKVVRWEGLVFKSPHDAVQYMKQHKNLYTKDELMDKAVELKKVDGLCYKDRCFDNIKDLATFILHHHDLKGELEIKRERDHNRLEKKLDTESLSFWDKYDNIHSHYNMLYKQMQKDLIFKIHERHRGVPLEQQ